MAGHARLVGFSLGGKIAYDASMPPNDTGTESYIWGLAASPSAVACARDDGRMTLHSPGDGKLLATYRDSKFTRRPFAHNALSGRGQRRLLSRSAYAVPEIGLSPWTTRTAHRRRPPHRENGSTWTSPRSRPPSEDQRRPSRDLPQVCDPTGRLLSTKRLSIPPCVTTSSW